MSFDLKPHTILLTVSGSRAYGIHTDASDVDLKGVAIPPRRYLLGCTSVFEQADDASQMDVFHDLLNQEETEAVGHSKLEGSIYALDKFCRLSMDGNPNMLDALFCRDQDIRHITKLGETLRDNRELFISAKCKHTFSGYAHQQLHRIKLHRRWLLNPVEEEPSRTEYNLFSGINPGQVKAAMAAVQKVIDGWELDLSRLDASERIPVMEGVAQFMAEYSIVGQDKWQAAARSIGYSDNFLEILDRERRWKNACEDRKKYEHWKKHRNPARAALEARYGYDTKHGAHLYRLLKMAKEILISGQVNIWRDDHEQILAIRSGQWSYEKLLEWADAQNREIDAIYKLGQYTIPKAPDRKAIESLCVDLSSRSLELPSH